MKITVFLLAVGMIFLSTCLADQENTPPSKQRPMLTKQTIETLKLFPSHRIYVVRSKKYHFTDCGTRSERVIIEATVIAGGDGTILLTRYSQGDPLLEPGNAYLIAAYNDGEWIPAWTLLEWHGVDNLKAEQMLEKARQQLGEN